MTKDEERTKALELIAGLAEDLKETVKEIESDQQIGSQFNYQTYWTIITDMAGKDKTQAMIIGMALMKAGANERGVRNAIAQAYP